MQTLHHHSFWFSFTTFNFSFSLNSRSFFFLSLLSHSIFADFFPTPFSASSEFVHLSGLTAFSFEWTLSIGQKYKQYREKRRESKIVWLFFRFFRLKTDTFCGYTLVFTLFRFFSWFIVPLHSMVNNYVCVCMCGMKRETQSGNKKKSNQKQLFCAVFISRIAVFSALTNSIRFFHSSWFFKRIKLMMSRLMCVFFVEFLFMWNIVECVGPFPCMWLKSHKKKVEIPLVTCLFEWTAF